jgi:hypothetical protein
MSNTAGRPLRVGIRLPLSAAFLAALGLAGGTLDAEDSPNPGVLVPVHGFTVQPMGNLSTSDGSLEFHPKALVGLGYDSNVYATSEDQSADTYYRGMVGLFSRYLPNPDLMATFDGEFERQVFLHDTSFNATIGRAVISCVQSGADHRWDAGAGFVRLDDPVFDSGERAIHDEITAHDEFIQDDALRHQSIELEYQRQDYLQGTAFFARQDMDRNLVTLTAHEGVRPLPDQEWYLGAILGYSHYDVDYFNSSSRITSFAGITEAIGSRSHAAIAIGASWWRFTRPFADDPSYADRDVVAPYVDSSLYWSWAEGSDLHVAVYSHLLESLISNAYWAIGSEVGGQQHVLDNSSAFFSLQVFRAYASGGPAGQDIEVRTQKQATVGFSYVMHDGVVTHIEGSYLDSNSRIYNTFDRLSATVDIALVY